MWYTHIQTYKGTFTHAFTDLEIEQEEKWDRFGKRNERTPKKDNKNAFFLFRIKKMKWMGETEKENEKEKQQQKLLSHNWPNCMCWNSPPRAFYFSFEIEKKGEKTSSSQYFFFWLLLLWHRFILMTLSFIQNKIFFWFEWSKCIEIASSRIELFVFFLIWTFKRRVENAHRKCWWVPKFEMEWNVWSWLCELTIDQYTKKTTGSERWRNTQSQKYHVYSCLNACNMQCTCVAYFKIILITTGSFFFKAFQIQTISMIVYIPVCITSNLKVIFHWPVKMWSNCCLPTFVSICFCGGLQNLQVSVGMGVGHMKLLQMYIT